MSSTFPDFLIFQLYGNLASWGDIAVGGDRPSYNHPSKSAILGLLGACLGIRREEDIIHKNMTNSYGIAICMQARGELLRDYHTIQVPKGNKRYYTRKDELGLDPLALTTILSRRDYQMDAYYLVAIWEKDKINSPFSLETLLKALKKPIFTTSLGRKSCPPCLPYFPKIFIDESLKNGCENYMMLDEIDTELPKDDLILWYWEDGLTDIQRGMSSEISYPRRDQIQSRQRWQFSKRMEYHYIESRWGNC